MNILRPVGQRSVDQADDFEKTATFECFHYTYATAYLLAFLLSCSLVHIMQKAKQNIKYQYYNVLILYRCNCC